MLIEPDHEKVQHVYQHLRDLQVSMLLTIGGDDTALSARLIAEHAAG